MKALASRVDRVGTERSDRCLRANGNNNLRVGCTFSRGCDPLPDMRDQLPAGALCWDRKYFRKTMVFEEREKSQKREKERERGRDRDGTWK